MVPSANNMCRLVCLILLLLTFSFLVSVCFGVVVAVVVVVVVVVVAVSGHNNWSSVRIMFVVILLLN